MENIKAMEMRDILGLQDKERCLYIPDGFVADIVKFMRAKKYLLKKKTGIMRLKYGFRFASNNYYNLIKVPIVMYDYTEDINVLGRLFEIMNDDYGFNIVEYARENNINVKVAVAIFCILHELAHNRYNAYFEEKGKGKNYINSKYVDEYIRVSHIEDRKQADYEYRKIASEKYADKMAIKIMKKHRVALRNICKRREDEFKYVDMTDWDNRLKYDYRFRDYRVKY